MFPKISLVKLDKPLEEEIFKFLLNLTESEKKARILKTSVKQKADASLAGELLAKVSIKRAFGIAVSKQVFGVGEYGKPFLPAYPNIHFNISHSGEWAACAVSDVPVGIDIQRIKPYNPAAAKRVCSDEEIKQIESSGDPASEFIKFWTRKEAVLKMRGTGIVYGELKSCLENSIVQSRRIGKFWLSAAEQKNTPPPAQPIRLGYY